MDPYQSFASVPVNRQDTLVAHLRAARLCLITMTILPAKDHLRRAARLRRPQSSQGDAAKQRDEFGLPPCYKEAAARGFAAAPISRNS